MKQQLKIKIAKNSESEGVWLTLPISQKEFNRQTKNEELLPKQYQIVSTCCNNYSLHQCLTKTRSLSKMNYLAAIFADFTLSQRVLFRSISDMYLGNSHCSIDDFINLAKNIEKNTSSYELFAIDIPPEFKLHIRRQK